MDKTSTEYWERKLKINNSASREIDWKNCSKAYGLLQFPKKRRVTKFLANQCATGKTMLKWKFWDHDRCPRCNEIEDNAHVITCTDERAQAIWDNSMASLEEWLKNAQTHPQLQELIIKKLNNMRHPSDTPNFCPEIQRVCEAQDNIGWFLAINGLLSHQ